MSRTIKWILGIFVLLFFWGIFLSKPQKEVVSPLPAVIVSPTGVPVAITIAPTKVLDKIAVSETALVYRGYSIFIVGTAKNNTDKEFKYVQLEFNVYDKAGNRIGGSMTNLNNFEAGGSWIFEALVWQKDVASFKLKDITAF